VKQMTRDASIELVPFSFFCTAVLFVFIYLSTCLPYCTVGQSFEKMIDTVLLVPPDSIYIYKCISHFIFYLPLLPSYY
jgi:hypothetical protein